ncbi:Hypothetical protein SCF082_LOCUS877 [Durusdinium trenchii]|uniref:Uncharacterized protein n=1 Tax=Durusdinium trenchii TaxID=1381693 RepID=A0ABP0HAF7_9DINO
MGGNVEENHRNGEPKPSPLVFSDFAAGIPQPPVKNTFVHYNVHCASVQVEQGELRRHQTAPAKTAAPAARVARVADDDESDEETDVPVEVLRPVDELKPMTLVTDEASMTGPPVPGELCRHSTHDAFEQGETSHWGMIYGQANEGHQNVMSGMQVLQEDMGWEGQMGGPTSGVLPMTSDTVMFVGVHPQVWMPPEEGSYVSGQVATVPMLQPMTLMTPHAQLVMEPTMQESWQQGWTSEGYYEQPLVPAHEGSPKEDASAALQSMVLGHVNNQLEPAQETPETTSQRFWDGLGVELLHQPQKIGRSLNMEHVYWVVDASKLNDKAKVLVSPEFKVNGNDTQFSFKMVMYPKDRTSFRAAGGQGFVQLKCESDTQDLQRCSLTFRMGICNGRAGDSAKRDGPRNAVTWDFKRSLVCDDEEVKQTWNFKDVVDTKTRTFAVCIEILAVEA